MEFPDWRLDLSTGIWQCTTACCRNCRHIYSDGSEFCDSCHIPLHYATYQDRDLATLDTASQASGVSDDQGDVAGAFHQYQLDTAAMPASEAYADAQHNPYDGDDPYHYPYTNAGHAALCYARIVLISLSSTQT